MAVTKKKTFGQIVVYFCMILIVLFALLPLYLTIILSLKPNAEMNDFVLTFPKQPMWSNYSNGFVSMLGNLLNSVAVAGIGTSIFVFLSAICGFVFARYKFPYKEVVFTFFIALLVFPGVLSLTPQYVLFVGLGLKNSWLSLILPYAVSGIAGAIFLFRSFFSQQPKELFEAGRIDGASEMKMFWQICVPLAVPILIVQALGTFSGIYNDYLWPMMIIENDAKQMVIPMLNALTQSGVGTYQEQGLQYALYLMSGIPLIVTTISGLKYFISADFASGMKL